MGEERPESAFSEAGTLNSNAAEAKCENSESLRPTGQGESGTEEVQEESAGDQQMAGEPEEVSEDDHNADEAMKAKPLRSPMNPTKAEIEEHEITHLPYRSWCSHCVRGKAVDDQHRSQTKDTEEDAIPRISIDYCFWNNHGMLSTWTQCSEEERQKSCPILVMHDTVSGSVFAYACEKKGGHTVVNETDS